MKSLAQSLTMTAVFSLATCVQAAWGQHWSIENYTGVIDTIKRNHNELATTANLPGFMLRTPEVTNGMIEMSYMFGYDDAQFGINGYMPLLNKYEVVGKDPSWIQYNLHTINQNMLGASGFINAGSPLSSVGLNDSNTPWLTESGEMLDYLNQRADQWELGLTPLSTSDKNPWRRAAATVGMFYDTTGQNNQGSYANNYVVTFTVDKNAVFRPNGNQAVFGAGMDVAVAADFVFDAGTSSWYPAANFNPAWLASLDNNLYRVDGLKYDTFGTFYREWWEQNIGDGSYFPWTGIGYTYDWYYQDNTQWSEVGPGNQPKGAGLSEFVVMPSAPETLWQIGSIVNIQTTATYLGDTQEWGSSMQTYSTPEPKSVFIFGLTGFFIAATKLLRRNRRVIRI